MSNITTARAAATADIVLLTLITFITKHYNNPYLEQKQID